MGARGPIPLRSEEKMGHPNVAEGEEQFPLIKTGPEELSRVQEFDIDLNPTQPDPEPGWEQQVKDLWEAMGRSPEATWMTAAAWAAFKISCEQLHRELKPQFVAINEKTGEVIRERVPMKGASLSAHLKFWGSLGMTEGDRRRMGREITLHKPYEVEAPAEAARGVSRNSVLASRSIGGTAS